MTWAPDIGGFSARVMGEEMAFRSNGPTVLSLPAFRGVTRRLVLVTLGMYFLKLVLGIVAPGADALVRDTLMLHPSEALGRYAWQVVTYPFVSESLLPVLFSLLSLWYFGSALEDERGSLWLTEYFFTATIGGGLLACLLSRTLLQNIAGLDPSQRTFGLWPAVMALLLAFARFHAEEEITFNFIFKVKAKYLAAIYLLVYLALTLSSRQGFDALTVVCAAVCGFGYLRLAPQRGLRFAASEQWFGLRNAYYRKKRQRAAKKFTVYMRKQGKDVSVDAEGRYVDPLGKPHDPGDKRWMN